MAGFKTLFAAVVTANWGDITSPKRVPSNDRLVANTLANQLASTPIRELSSGTHANTNSAGGGVSYDLIFSQTGNKMTVWGTINNGSSGSIGGNQDLVVFSNADWNSRTSFNTDFPYSNNQTIRFEGNKIKLLGVMSSGQTLRINHTYLLND